MQLEARVDGPPDELQACYVEFLGDQNSQQPFAGTGPVGKRLILGRKDAYVILTIDL